MSILKEVFVLGCANTLLKEVLRVEQAGGTGKHF